jgi:hypothetical protein
MDRMLLGPNFHEFNLLQPLLQIGIQPNRQMMRLPQFTLPHRYHLSAQPFQFGIHPLVAAY